MRPRRAGGFVRWALVTPDKINDQAAHNAGAFAWGCYSVGRYTCSSAEKAEHCGADNTGSAERTEGVVPTNLPDGDYVLGWVWYGGFNRPSIGTSWTALLLLLLLFFFFFFPAALRPWPWVPRPTPQVGGWAGALGAVWVGVAGRRQPRWRPPPSPHCSPFLAVS